MSVVNQKISDNLFVFFLVRNFRNCIFAPRSDKASGHQVDLVAQLVEHITFNDGALGSSPSGIT